MKSSSLLGGCCILFTHIYLLKYACDNRKLRLQKDKTYYKI